MKIKFGRNMNFYVKDRKDLSMRETQKIVELIVATWPDKKEENDIVKTVKKYRDMKLNPFDKVILSFHGDELVGHTGIFNREIRIKKERLQILALSGVCVKSTFRSRHIGSRLVKKAFESVDNGQFICSIFQTNVPGFYEKLLCKQIHNRFINTKSKEDIYKTPWDDPYVMVYPNTYDLKDGTIDLNGDCY